ncbi:hypothetical protein P4C99_08170 [Pontiellaceae bacterium B1224]|nr:hypothetical protein [Pontiellaceae bacterium B1224]
MIESVGSSSMSIPPQRMQQSLSSEQQSLVEETLQQYDLENLTEEDAQAIVETFKAAGIEPGQALEQAMADAGADAEEVGELAGVQGPQGNRPPPPPRPAGAESEDTEALEISSLVEYLEEILSEKEVAELSDEEKQEIYTQVVEHFGLSAGESLINIKV